MRAAVAHAIAGCLEVMRAFREGRIAATVFRQTRVHLRTQAFADEHPLQKVPVTAIASTRVRRFGACYPDLRVQVSRRLFSCSVRPSRRILRQDTSSVDSIISVNKAGR